MLDANQRPGKRPASRLARWWSRMLDGEYHWGSIDIWPSRHGVHRYRLVVFPPGMSVGERRVLQLWRTWPMWGAVLWLLSAICLGGRPTPWAAIGLATIVYLSTGAIIVARARHLRSRVRTLGVLVIDGRSDRRSAAGYAELETLVSTLRDADAKLSEGRLSAVDHEAACWQVYDRLGPDHPRPVEGHLSN
jgi:hypothetical protein